MPSQEPRRLEPRAAALALPRTSRPRHPESRPIFELATLGWLGLAAAAFLALGGCASNRPLAAGSPLGSLVVEELVLWPGSAVGERMALDATVAYKIERDRYQERDAADFEPRFYLALLLTPAVGGERAKTLPPDRVSVVPSSGTIDLSFLVPEAAASSPELIVAFELEERIGPRAFETLVRTRPVRLELLEGLAVEPRNPGPVSPGLSGNVAG